MTTRLSILIVTLLLFAGERSMANEPIPSIAVRALELKSFALYLTGIEDNKVKIQILDKQGRILLTNNVRNKKSFARKFNMKNFDNGRYAIKITDEFKTQVYPLIIEADKLLIHNEELKTIYAPVVQYHNKNLNLMVFSPSKEKRQITIYNASNEVVHDEIIEEKVNYQKRFSFADALRGTYRLVISSQGNEYTYVMPVN